MSEQALKRPTTTEALSAIGTDYRLAGLLLIGMGPGLSITISGGTISFWLAENGFSPSQIGFLALAMLPFVFKFIWAPLLDGSLKPLERLFGFRKSWLIPLNLLTVSAIVFLSRSDPSNGSLSTIAIAAFLFSFCAASQEAVAEGLRIDRTKGASMGVGVTLTSIGARFGLLVGSAAPLLIASRAGWPAALLTMAGLMLLVSVGALILGDSRQVDSKAKPLALRTRLVGPFQEFFSRDGALLVFAFMLLIRLGDSMAGAMFPPFAISAGFTKDQIAFASSMVGFFAVIAGSIVGVFIYRSFSERMGLFIAVLFVAVSNIGYVALTYYEGNPLALALAMGFENFSGGIGAVMLLSYMSRLCDVRFTATQFALLTAAAAFTRLGAAGPSGQLVEAFGYKTFFWITVAASLPVIALLAVMIRRGLVSGRKPSPRRSNAATFE